MTTLKTPLTDEYKDHQLHFPSADWFVLWTIEKMQTEYKNFRFLGTGWYTKGDDTLLILKGVGDKYWIYVWNERDPRDTMRMLLEQPEHK